MSGHTCSCAKKKKLASTSIDACRPLAPQEALRWTLGFGAPRSTSRLPAPRSYYIGAMLDLHVTRAVRVGTKRYDVELYIRPVSMYVSRECHAY